MDIALLADIDDTVLTSSNILENDESVWAALTSYTAGDVVMVTTGYHKIYLCMAASTGDFPPDNIYDSSDSSGHWSEVSATNRWKMFDNKIQSQSERASNITIELTLAELTNCLGIFGLDADDLNVKVVVSGVERYNEDISLKDLSAINSYYEWFFSPITNKETIVLLDLPAYTNSVITLTFTKADGGTVRVGQVAPCRKYDIGGTDKGGIEQGTRLGKRTFSRKEIDTDGYATIDVQKVAKTIDYHVIIKVNKATYLDRLLSKNFNVPIILVGDELLEWSKLFGFIQDFTIVFGDGNYVFYNLRAEELV